MRVAVYASERDNRPESRDLPWVLLAKVLTAFREGPCTSEDCPGKKCPHKSGPAWSPADYPEGATRGNRNVRAITALVYDLDDVVSEEWETRLRLAGLAHAVHSTHTSREGACYLRLIIPLSRPLTVAEHPIAWRALIDEYGLPADTACGDPARLYYLPSAPIGVPHHATTHPGAALNVDAVLAALPAVRPIEPSAPSGLTDKADTGERPPASPATIQAALRRLLAHGPAIEGQGGDKHTLTAACIARNDFALSEAEALDVLEIWNRANVPPWDRADLETKIANAERYSSGETGAARAAAETKAMMLGASASPGVSGGGLLGLPPPEPEPEPGSWGDHLRRARKLVAERLGEREERTDAGPMFESADALLGREHAPPAWLVRGLITEGGLAVIATEPKAAKTWAATEIAIAKATGTPAFGVFDVGAAALVAYFYAEDLGASVATRYRALVKKRKLGADGLSKLFAQPRGRDLNVCDNEQLANLIASVWMLGPIALLVLDPLRDIHNAEEDSSDEMAEVMHRLRFIAASLGCTVLFVHHSKKQSADSKGTRGGQMMRGSSAIHGSVDSAMYFRDLKVEGSDTFTSNVHSEIKGARGAGFFELTLKIDDDPKTGTAIDATWTVDRAPRETKAEAKAEKRDTELEGKILTELRHAGPQRRDALFKLVGGNKQKFTDAVRTMRDARPARLYDAHGLLSAVEVKAPPIVPGSAASKFVKPE